jgi:LacI family transcriptional regulator
MLMGIDDGLRETDYHLIITTSRTLETELETFARLVEKQHVDAMIFSRTRREDPRIAYLQKRRIPFATFGRSETGKPFPYVDIDYAAAGREGVMRLFARGHRRIALVNSPSYYMFGNLRRQGYEAAIRECGLAPDPGLYVEEDITEDGGARGLQQVMRATPAPTAILCAHDLTAIGVMRALVAAGKRPGEDVAVIGSDDDPIGRYCNPALTTFSAETRRAGQRIVELLLAAMQGTPVASLQEVWTPQLIVRASDGPA